VLLLAGAPSLAAQQPGDSTGSRITDAGVLRAAAKVDSVFIVRNTLVDTVDIGDFAGYLLARLGVPPFGDSLAFRVTADTAQIRITGRLMDFPPEARGELGVIFSFIDSTATFRADIGMPQHAGGIMKFRLLRVVVGGLPIPELLLLPALAEYARRYPVLASGGREFLVAMPLEATATLVRNGLELRMPEPTGHPEQP
jgi:hypothetical protein